MLRGRHAWQTFTMINSCPETYVPTVEGRMDPELASTVTYGLIVKTVFMEDNLTRLRGITKEEERRFYGENTRTFITEVLINLSKLSTVCMFKKRGMRTLLISGTCKHRLE